MCVRIKKYYNVGLELRAGGLTRKFPTKEAQKLVSGSISSYVMERYLKLKIVILLAAESS